MLGHSRQLWPFNGRHVMRYSIETVGQGGEITGKRILEDKLLRYGAKFKGFRGDTIE